MKNVSLMILLCVCLCLGNRCFSQLNEEIAGILPSTISKQPPPADTSLVVIGDIAISGNKKTKAYIIEREIPFKQGDYLLAQDLSK